MLNFKINPTNLDKNFFVYYDGDVEDGLIDGYGEIWLFCPDESMYFWEGQFADGYPVRTKCIATNFPYGANLLTDLCSNLECSSKKSIFAKGFTYRNEFIIPLLERRESVKRAEPVLLPAFERFRSAMFNSSDEADINADAAPATPKSLPSGIVDTPERVTYYARQSIVL